ncbi:NAD(+) diphosphatase [Glaciecola sp. KUL10]|uniref:NAD(+) diphosphatase n=1 Tax=Glaciecola sp. (strain KUL10) TaxID=2161813 RepID=UPI000D788C8C|nr:NAD(+) diphosphatase [Glaciecola sp. KUL10]GBL04619.1 NUDIX hydrolase [Glaciecola sp. KUL10]
MNKTRYFFVFNQNKLLLPSDADLSKGLDLLIDFEHLAVSEYQDQAVTFKQEEHAHFSLIDTQQEAIEHPELRQVSLREMLVEMPSEAFYQVAQAWQFALFMRTHQFCGRCGARMDKVTWEMAMHCHTCHHRCYPRVSPCIIVAIRHRNSILLAQGARQKEVGYFSTLAGFVESSETLEQAVHREVFEEVGVRVKNLEYFDSQPWPFPHSLMCGFLAEYDAGDIKVDGKEILQADFFDIDELPTVPPSFSIAGRLIDETRKRIKQ